jgi:hypothetical protein
LTKSTNFHSGKTIRLSAWRLRIVISVLPILFLSSFHSAVSTPDAELVIRFRAYVHGEPLELKKKYKNPFGEIFEISRFRFYAGRITPVYSDSQVKPDSQTTYHLIDFSDSLSTCVVIPVTAGLCSGIQFLLGVDSLDQNRGAQTGVLDPSLGMYWTWNSGYQSFKIEGNSPASGQPAHLMAYHIGGYRFPYSTVWKIRINTTDGEVFRISKENKITVEIPIELDYFFDGQTPLRIREIPSCTTAGELAWKISENFIGSFNGLTLAKNP